ncbi:MAG: lytic transglycosylase domain-containing protein [Fischerella sp.]|nr:lytic transglycosylase domain-containing protein [Fischerella sp.]
MYILIGEGLGQAAQKSPLSQTSSSSLSQQLQDALRQGAWSLAIGLSLLLGNRDVNKLTDMVFFAQRHPSRQNQPLTSDEKQQWIRIRDHLVRPTLAKLSTKRTPIPISVASTGTKVDPNIVSLIAKYDDIIDRIALAKKVDSNIVRGIIAAESGGDPCKEAPSGYKGLMQAERTKDQFDPEVSIRDGTEKFKNFRDQWLGPRLKALGIDLKSVDKETMVRWVTTAYNAGHVTVLKAVEYATASGNPKNWMAPEHYQRALIFSGGYSVRTAAASCLKGLDGDTLANELAKLTHMNINDIRNTYFITNKWNIEGLKQALINEAIKEWKRWRFKGKGCQWWKCPDPPPLEDIRKQVSNLLMCAVQFKYDRTPGYTNKIIRYMQHYDRLRSGN